MRGIVSAQRNSLILSKKAQRARGRTAGPDLALRAPGNRTQSQRETTEVSDESRESHWGACLGWRIDAVERARAGSGYDQDWGAALAVGHHGHQRVHAQGHRPHDG